MKLGFHVLEPLTWKGPGGISNYLPGFTYRVTPANRDWAAEQVKLGKAALGTATEGSALGTPGAAAAKVSGTLVVQPLDKGK